MAALTENLSMSDTIKRIDHISACFLLYVKNYDKIKQNKLITKLIFP
jgi:hypothetical protein